MTFLSSFFFFEYLVKKKNISETVILWVYIKLQKHSKRKKIVHTSATENMWNILTKFDLYIKNQCQLFNDKH